MLVCQSSSVENVLAKTRGTFTDESFTSTTTIVAGASTSWSLRVNEFDQLKPPILRGVLKLELVFLVFRLRRTLSCPPLGFRKKRYVNSPAWSMLKRWSVWKFKPGVQSSHEARDNVGTVMLKFGKLCATSFRPGY